MGVYRIRYSNELRHHGVKGMKWGVRKEYQPVGRKSSSGAKGSSEEKKRRKLTAKQKRIIGAVAGTAALAATGYVLYKTGAFNKMAALGKKSTDIQRRVIEKGLLPKAINKAMVKSINAEHKGTFGGSMNCSHTSTSYILNRVLGMNTTAKTYTLDELPGLSTPYGMKYTVFDLIFDNTKSMKFMDDSTNKSLFGHYGEPSLHEANKLIPNNSVGIAFVKITGGGGHFLNYEKSSNGVMTFVDCQSGKIKDISKMPKGWTCKEIIDCTNATLADGADLTLNHMVNGLIKERKDV